MSARHQVILAQIKHIIDCGLDLQTNITVTETGDTIKKQAEEVVDALNVGLRTITASGKALTWDGLLVGSLRFFLGIMDAAEDQLQDAMMYAEIPLEGKETIH